MVFLIAKMMQFRTMLFDLFVLLNMQLYKWTWTNHAICTCLVYLCNITFFGISACRGAICRTLTSLKVSLPLRVPCVTTTTRHNFNFLEVALKNINRVKREETTPWKGYWSNYTPKKPTWKLRFSPPNQQEIVQLLDWNSGALKWILSLKPTQNDFAPGKLMVGSWKTIRLPFGFDVFFQERC